MKKLVSEILAISALVASANAMAQEQKAYIGGSFGFATANIDCVWRTELRQEWHQRIRLRWL
jgi:hypothetical protein